MTENGGLVGVSRFTRLAVLARWSLNRVVIHQAMSQFNVSMVSHFQPCRTDRHPFGIARLRAAFRSRAPAYHRSIPALTCSGQEGVTERTEQVRAGNFAQFFADGLLESFAFEPAPS